MSAQTQALPLVYACSGCSSAAQLANHVAVRLDRSGVAEMSCIAGVGGDVPSLLKTVRSGRSIIALDGCPLVCVKSSLARHGIAPDRHGVGTNGLSLPLPAARGFRFAFGDDSFALHQAEAARLGLIVEVIHSPTLAKDIDVPADLADADRLLGE